MKKIAISQRIILDDKKIKKDCLEQDYIKYYQKFNFLLIPIPNNIKNLKEYLSELDIEGIILSGGGDIHPHFYGGEIQKNKNYDKRRDIIEKKLIDFAMSKKIPVLGECRGAQFINVYFGGKLSQNIKDHVNIQHEIKIFDKKFKNYFKKDKIIVNSYHNNGISNLDLSKNLKIFAKSTDEYIEGLYHKKLPIVGIMWHPERKGNEKNSSLELINYLFNNFNSNKSAS